MSKAVQAAVQGRYRALQDAASEAGPSEIVTGIAHVVRQPGERAILVNERSTVWDRPLQPPAPEDPLAAIADPIWDHREGTRWTPDLVHCRFIGVADTISRLPGATIGGYGSLLGQIVERDESPVVRRPPSPAEITIADWTWAQLLRQRDEVTRGITIGIAFGLSVRALGKRLGMGKSTIADRYLAERRRLAAHWISEKHPVDAMAFERWVETFKNARK